MGKPYIYVRLRGAIIDEMRRHDWLPKGQRKKGEYSIFFSEELDEMEIEEEPIVDVIINKQGLKKIKENINKLGIKTLGEKINLRFYQKKIIYYLKLVSIFKIMISN